MAQRLAEYGPVLVGTGTDYETEIAVAEPFQCSIGFERPLTAEEAIAAVPAGWELRSPLSPERDGPSRLQYDFEDPARPWSPDEIHAIINASDSIQYMVPAFRAEAYGSKSFTPSPNHVVVLINGTDESLLDDIDARADTQGFSRVEYREFEIDGRIRRVYWSPESDHESESEGSERYTGEPGPALFLINALTEEFGEDGVVAEPDWFVSGVNDLATGATTSSSTSHSPQLTSGPQASTDPGAARVAILDGEFDLDYTNGRLPFSTIRYNVIHRNEEVGVEKDHAHGTLCAGLIGAQKPIPNWDEAGVAPGVQMVPVSIYEIADPVQAKLGHLVEGIRFAVTNGCKVVSISVAGYLPGSDLITIVEWAERRGVVLVSGTGNRVLADPDKLPAGVVLFPAKFQSVLGVGAADVNSETGEPILHRIQGGMFLPGQVEWESHFGEGLDVVAQGLGVTSTDISGAAGASPTDLWDSFSGTSASTPLVAGFAARIAGATNLKPAQIRAEVKRTARRLRPFFDPATVEPRWVAEVGCGFIDRGVIERWRPSPQGALVSETEDEGMPEAISAVECSNGRQIVDVAGEMGLPDGVVGMFKDSLRPLGDFLIALGSSDEPCATMATEFWRDPYRIARVLGLPWHAAVLLGQGEWEAVYEAVDAENHRNRSNSAGPIWVRVH